MLFRHPRFESLEIRRLLNADDVGAVISEVAASQASLASRTEEVSGLLRYQSNGSLIATNDASTHEAQQHWPNEAMPLDWAPLLSGDFNGDGRMDVLGSAQKNRDDANNGAAATSAGQVGLSSDLDSSLDSESGSDLNESQLWLHTNDGDAFYLLPWSGALPLETQVIGTGDVNGDGLLDVVSFNDQTNEVWVSVNDQQFGFRNELWARLSESVHTKLFVGDFDRDGMTDVLAGGRAGRWLLAKSHETRFRMQDWGPYAVFDWEEIVSGDFDGDQQTDIAARAPDRTWWVWLGDADGMEPAKYWGHWKMGTDWTDVKVADLNVDGLDDIVGRSAEGTLHVATAVDEESNGKAEFHSWRWSTGWIARAEWRNTIVRDMTGDGLPDYVGQAKDGTWWVGENVGRNFSNYYLDRTPAGLTVDYIVDADQRVATTSSATSILGHFPLETDEFTASSLEQNDAPDFAAHVPLRVSLNNDDQLVLEGNGQNIRAIEFRSASGSLIPLPSLEANGFSELPKNDQLSIRLATNDSVTIDGSVVLGVKWDRSKNASDLEVIYDIVDLPAVVNRSSFEELNPDVEQLTTAEHYAALYPNSVTSLPITKTPPTIDEPTKTEVASPEDEPPPADAVESQEEIESESNSDVPADEGQQSTAQQPTAQQPTVSLVLDDSQNQFVLRTPDTPIYALRIESPTSALLPGTSPYPFDELVVSDSGLVVYASESPVMVESAALDLFWQREQVTDQVIAEFGVGSADWRPISLFGVRVSDSSQSSFSDAADKEPVETELAIESELNEEAPNSDPATNEQISVKLNDDNRFVVSAVAQPLLGINFLSGGGGLVPGTSPAPFELFVSNTPRLVTLGTFGRLVNFDGNVTLDVGWSPEHSLDNLIIEIGGASGQLIPTQRNGDGFASLSTVNHAA